MARTVHLSVAGPAGGGADCGLGDGTDSATFRPLSTVLAYPNKLERASDLEPSSTAHKV